MLKSKPVFAVGVVVAIAMTVAVLALFVFPTRQYFDQRDRIEEAERVLIQLRTETDTLSEQVRTAKFPSSVERSARENLSLIREGDTLYRLSVNPADSLSLPASWPLPGIAHLFGGG